MKYITLSGVVFVSDALTALEPLVDNPDLFMGLDEAVSKRSGERLQFDDIEVLAEEAIDALERAGKLPEPESLTYTLDERTVINLAEAIRCGERERAEQMLDLLFADTAEFPTIREWVDRGRYSMKARKAKASAPAGPAKLRNAA